ncbi:MAG TPA: cupin domain-containing protein, partial [Beijerinckiaceae bacterium]|nr:cupin domain-containing protein [Beijerinckiaceae bacterium]
MPKLDITLVPERNSTSYPEPFRAAVSGRFWRALGQAAGLTQFGVNLVRLEPGAWSSQRHWHESEDEFLIVLEGELVLVEDEGETILRAGDAAGFKAGVPNGHHLLNRTERDGVFLVVGSR